MSALLESSVVSEVEPGLFVGSLSSLGLLEPLAITHVVSVLNFPLEKDLSAYKTLHIPLKDSEDSNLLVHLPGAYTFMREALAPEPPNPPGRVLVHCQGGISRSVSIVVAYLMKAYKLDRQQALNQVRRTRPSAEPNEGFMAQLDLFADMRCSLDLEHPVYRLWCVEQVGMQREEEGWVDPDTFCVLPEDAQAAASQEGCTLYRCRKCRRLIATSKQVLPVEAAAGHRIFRRGPYGSTAARQDKGNKPQQQEEGGASLFVEPISWMADSVVGAVQGKLYCPGCQARLGSFNWSGISNERGQWVTPGFQLHLSKLDTILPPRPLSSIAPMAVPMLRASSGSSNTQPGASNTGVSHTQQPLSSSSSSAQPGMSNTGMPHTQQPLSSSSSSSAQGQSAAQHTGVATHSEGLQGVGSPNDGSHHREGQHTCSGRARTAWFDTLVLDCDGVLVDSERASCEALRRSILQVTGLDVPHEFPQDFYEVFGMDVRSCIAHYKEKFGRSDWTDVAALAASVQEVKEHHYKELTEAGISAFPGAAALIRCAHELGMAVSVGSSGAPEKIARNLALSGLAPLFDPQHIVSAAYVPRGKPAPDVYLECMRRQGCSEPSKALVVEDAVNGLKAAKAAGAFAVGITNSLPDHVLSPHADFVVSHHDQLRERIAQLTWKDVSKPPAAS